MKKTLGVVAAAAMAALPMASVLATAETGHTYVDHLAVTIADNCEFTRATTPHTPEDQGWTAGMKGTVTTEDTDTLAVSIANGVSIANIGTSKFHAVCNNTAGYTLTVKAAANLVSGEDTISFSSTAVSDAESGVNQSAYSISYLTGAINAGVSTGYQIKQESETDLAGKDYVFTYGAAIASGQASGTYTGDIQYIFAQAE